MKVGVLSVQGLHYGGRLQNYALQAVPGRMGHGARMPLSDLARMSSPNWCVREVLNDYYSCEGTFASRREEPTEWLIAAPEACKGTHG